MRKMKNTIYTLLLSIVLPFCITACASIHDEPDGEGINPTKVSVTLDFLFKEVSINTMSHTMAKSSVSIDPLNDHSLRYVVEIYSEVGGGAPLHRFVKCSDQLKDNDVTIDVTLNASSYIVLAWVDYVPKGSQSDYLYNTQSLKSVEVKAPYSGSIYAKDAFAAKASLDLRSYGNSKSSTIKKTIELKRPLSSFVIVATDMSDYLFEQGGGLADADIPVTADFTYHASLAVAYNVFEGSTATYSDKEVFSGQVEDHTEESCVIAYDYVLMDSESSNVEVSFDIYSLSGVHINRINNLKIPLKRNTQTVVKLPCLIPSDGNGGIDIEDGFDGPPIEIVIPD